MAHKHDIPSLDESFEFSPALRKKLIISALIGVVLVSGVPMFGYEPINWTMAFCLALFCNLMGHSVFSWSLKYLKPTYVSTAKLAGPVFASVNAFFLFNEVPSIVQILGALVVIVGVGMYARQEQN